MKKILAAVLALCLLLAGCAAAETVYTVEQAGEVFTVDRGACTIAHGEDVYRYNLNGTDIDIVYPNGSTYWQNKTKHGSVGSWDGDYDTERYVDGMVLAEVLESELPGEPASVWKFVLAAIVALCGVWQMIWPEAAWRFAWGWRFKNADPSDAALGITRLGGGALVVIAVVLLFVV